MEFFRRLFFVIFILGTTQAFSNQKPNIILMMVDDLGYADIGPYGQKKIKTPHLDDMAKNGIKFTQYYAGLSVCAPSRSILMEGLHSGHCTIRNNKQNEEFQGQWPLPKASITLPKALKKGGYRTGMIGKWGLGNPGSSGDPLKQGWDFYYGYTDQVLAHNYYPDHLLKNGQKISLKNKPIFLPNKFNGLGSYTPQPIDYSHDFFLKETKAFISKNRNHPFFLYLPFTIPHDNGEQLKGMRFEVPHQGIYNDRSWTKEQKDYASMITYLDKSVGDILNWIKQFGIEKNTLFLFCSDNGPLRNYPVTKFFDSNGNLRGGKRDLYEGGIRSPLIAYWPSIISPGQVSNHICAAWDFFPTFCDLANIDTPKNLDGLSMRPILKGQKQPTHDHLYWEFHTKQGIQAVRMGKWKGIRFNAGLAVPNPVQLFDLENDIGETNNLADQYPKISIKISQIMDRSHAPSKLFPFPKEM